MKSRLQCLFYIPIDAIFIGIIYKYICTLSLHIIVYSNFLPSIAMPENANRTKNTLAMEAGKHSTIQCTFQTVNIVLILVQQRDDTFLLVQR